jgi:hypothetical protein
MAIERRAGPMIRDVRAAALTPQRRYLLQHGTFSRSKTRSNSVE